MGFSIHCTFKEKDLLYQRDYLLLSTPKKNNKKTEMLTKAGKRVSLFSFQESMHRYWRHILVSVETKLSCFTITSIFIVFLVSIRAVKFVGGSNVWRFAAGGTRGTHHKIDNRWENAIVWDIEATSQNLSQDVKAWVPISFPNGG